MTEIDFSKESGIPNSESNRRQECYLTLLKNILFNDKKFEEIPHKEIDNIFSIPEKFKELEESFKEIFSRRKGKASLSEDEKTALTKWYGLEKGEAYYKYSDGYEKIGQELKASSFQTGRIINRAFEKLRKPENLNLLPQEAKKLLT